MGVSIIMILGVVLVLALVVGAICAVLMGSDKKDKDK